MLDTRSPRTSRPVAPRRLELGPDGVREAAERLALTAAEARLLAPDHPFLEAGLWRAFAVERDGALAARLVASVDPRQRDAAGQVGCIGFVRLGSEGPVSADDSDAARQVLASALCWLRSRGVSTIRCPVQLSTWYGHRAMTGGFPDEEAAVPTFPLEPSPEPELPGLIHSTGFRPAHRAVSCLVDSAAVVAGTAAIVSRVRRAGVRDRAIRLAELDDELRRLHRLAEASFEGTWALSPISFDEFASIYRPLYGQVDPELIRILEAADGTPIGFALGLQAGPPRDPGSSSGVTFVLKSIGVVPEARERMLGIGAALVGMLHGVAVERGFRTGIHALMAEGSNALRLSLHWGRDFRSYATYELRAP